MKILIRIIFLTPLLLPILIYPMILIANIMSLAAYVPEDVTLLERIAPQLFLWATTLYPLVIGYLLFKWKKSLKVLEERKYIYWAYGYVFWCFLFFQFWALVSG